MNGGDALFQKLWGGSLVAHLVFFSLLFLLPAGAPRQTMVPVYHVKILELPAQPVAPSLDISTLPPPGSENGTEGLQPEDSPPEPLAVPSAPPLPPFSSSAPALPPPEPLAPLIQPKAPEAPPPPPVKDSRPPLPELPGSITPNRSAPAPAPTFARPSAPQPVPEANRPSTSTTMEKLREKVQTLQMKFEEIEVESPQVGMAPTRAPSSRLSLRIYQNSLREEIKRRYTFPGNFDPALRARVRITVNRDGTVAKTEILDSSGNSPFDYAVTLTLRRAKFPPIPNHIEGDTVTQVILFSPDIFSGGR